MDLQEFLHLELVVEPVHLAAKARRVATKAVEEVEEVEAVVDSAYLEETEEEVEVVVLVAINLPMRVAHNYLVAIQY